MGDPQNILGTANAINIGQKLLMMISKYILGTANAINNGQKLLMMISKSENYIKNELICITRDVMALIGLNPTHNPLHNCEFLA